MRYFVITVARPGGAGKDITVEARNMTEAKRMALAMVGCSNSYADTCDYAVTNVMVYPRGEAPPASAMSPVTAAPPTSAAPAAATPGLPALPEMPGTGDAWI